MKQVFLILIFLIAPSISRAASKNAPKPAPFDLTAFNLSRDSKYRLQACVVDGDQELNITSDIERSYLGLWFPRTVPSENWEVQLIDGVSIQPYSLLRVQGAEINAGLHRSYGKLCFLEGCSKQLYRIERETYTTQNGLFISVRECSGSRSCRLVTQHETQIERSANGDVVITGRSDIKDYFWYRNDRRFTSYRCRFSMDRRKR